MTVTRASTTTPTADPSRAFPGWENLHWWMLITDVSVATAVASRVPGASVLVRDGNGQPWLVGTVRPCQVHSVQVGRVSTAALGDPAVAGGTVEAVAQRGAGALLDLAGAFQLAQLGPAGADVWTDPVGYHRAYTATWRGRLVVGSHAGPLAWLTGAGLDRRWWAARLCSPEMPAALRDLCSPYAGVCPVPAGYRLQIPREGGASRCSPWWQPPDADLALPAAAGLLRDRLSAAVTGRISAADGPITVQLSGGLDSTALAIVAARTAAPQDVLLATVQAASPANTDTVWARRVAGALPAARHRMVGVEEIPGFFEDLPEATPRFDEPVGHVAGVARTRYVAHLLGAHGSAVHLNGQGGDEAVTAPLAYLRDLLGRDRRRGWLSCGSRPRCTACRRVGWPPPPPRPGATTGGCAGSTRGARSTPRRRPSGGRRRR